MGESLYDFCIRGGRQELLNQWLEKENLPATPQSISYGSRRKVWWQCGEGHRWQAAVYTRTGNRTGCPVCAGKIPLAGNTDLAASHPTLAHQWHGGKNNGLTPEQFLPGSHRVVWWICEKGHEWQASIKSRVAGSGCPVCADRVVRAGENDLASRYPGLAAQWDRERNGRLTPEDVLPGTKRRVWWICERGHRWQSSVASRTWGGSGCPYCAGRKVLPGFNDLASRFPALAVQWHPVLNGELTAEMVTPGSRRKVWWICPQGHVWRAAVYSRAGPGRSGCPVCAGAARRRKPEEAALV